MNWRCARNEKRLFSSLHFVAQLRSLTPHSLPAIWSSTSICIGIRALRSSPSCVLDTRIRACGFHSATPLLRPATKQFADYRRQRRSKLHRAMIRHRCPGPTRGFRSRGFGGTIARIELNEVESNRALSCPRKLEKKIRKLSETADPNLQTLLVSSFVCLFDSVLSSASIASVLSNFKLRCIAFHSFINSFNRWLSRGICDLQCA